MALSYIEISLSLRLNKPSKTYKYYLPWLKITGLSFRFNSMNLSNIKIASSYRFRLCSDSPKNYKIIYLYKSNRLNHLVSIL